MISLSLFFLLITCVPLLAFRFELGPLPLDAVTVGASLLIFAALVEIYRKKDIFKKGSPYALPFALFLIVGLISLFSALDFIEGLAVWLRHLGYFLLSYACARCVKNREMLEAVLTVMVLTAGVVCLIGLYQYVFRPEASLGMAGLSEIIKARIAATYENPNFLSEYLVLIFPLGLALVFAKGSVSRKISLIFLSLFIFFALILTYTRGSWISLFISVTLFSFLVYKPLFFLFLGVVVLSLVFMPGVSQRLWSIFDTGGGTAGFRVRLWQIPLRMITEHPILGVGIGNYLIAFTSYILRHPELNLGWVQYGAHNSYLTYWAEIGLIGLLSFFFILLTAVRSGFYLNRALIGDHYLRCINAGILAALIGFMFNALTSNSFYHPRAAVFFWVLIGLQMALFRIPTEVFESKRAPILENSLFLKAVRSLSHSFKLAYQNHFVYRGIKAIFNKWQGSFVGRWWYADPLYYSFVSESKLIKKIMGKM